jgi:hypothetical protein
LLGFHFALISETLGHHSEWQYDDDLLTAFSTGVDKPFYHLKTGSYAIIFKLFRP